MSLSEGGKAALRMMDALSRAGLGIPPGPAVCLGLAAMGDEAILQLGQMLGQHRGNREAVRALLAVHFRHLGLGAEVREPGSSSGQVASGPGDGAAAAAVVSAHLQAPAALGF